MNRSLGCNIRSPPLPEPFTVYSDGPVTPLFEEFPAGVKLNDCETAEERRALWRDRDFRAGFVRQWRGAHRTFHRRLELVTVVPCSHPSLLGTPPPGPEDVIGLHRRHPAAARLAFDRAHRSPPTCPPPPR